MAESFFSLYLHFQLYGKEHRFSSLMCLCAMRVPQQSHSPIIRLQIYRTEGGHGGLGICLQPEASTGGLK